MIDEAVTLHDDGAYARYTLTDQERVGLTLLDGAALKDGTFTVTLLAVSWSAIALG